MCLSVSEPVLNCQARAIRDHLSTSDLLSLTFRQGDVIKVGGACDVIYVTSCYGLAGLALSVIALGDFTFGHADWLGGRIFLVQDLVSDVICVMSVLIGWESASI